ncbi:gliding motility-associated C-terminal domain-containing protein [Hymenobacter nivis]|nr:gliding motility-associated C-terminal domain-containing protein [Hymenobacter nivis]
MGWLLALLLLLGGASATLAQTAPPAPPECAADEKFANTWYFGYKAGLDFNNLTVDSLNRSSLPKVLTDGAMDAPAGSGVMSDKNGKILFYSNGETVWNGDGTVMTNGTGLAGNRFTTDGPLPLKMPGIPMPGQPTRYLLFTLNSTVGLSYSEITIPAGGGPGTVILATRNTPLARGTAEKLTGVFHKNGCDIWVITHGWGDAKTGNDNRGDAFLAYRVQQAANYIGPVLIDAPIISTIGSLHAPSKAALGYKGQMKVTPDGQRLALARYSEVLGDSSSTVELFGFNTNTGTVSANPMVPYIVDKGAGKYYGVGFSPGSYLYATVMNPPKLLQFDISGNGPVPKPKDIPLKQKTPADLGSLQAAPDGKIYVARNNQPALGFITYPDSLGAKARYADDSLKLGGRLSGLGLVNFNQSSLLQFGFGAQSTACLEITFTSPPVNFALVSYSWDFGDGSPKSMLANPPHTFPSAKSYTVTLLITTGCFCRQIQFQVPVPGAPTPGSIGAAQTLCGGSTPAPLTSTAAPGAGTGQFTFQWQSSPDNTTWADINGANGPGFAPGPLTVTTYFRRLVTSGFCAPRTPTASVAITVLPVLTAGSITADQTVCAGSGAVPLMSTSLPIGGTGTFIYQWESSPDNIAWTAIAGATNATFVPGILAATTYFRRRVTSGPCGAVSNAVKLTVLPALLAGTIAANQAICLGAAPAPLTSETPATGGPGPIAYQWEFSPDNATWTAINGATGLAYAPGSLGSTAYFRRRASSPGTCAPVFSNVVVITVAPALAAGTIGSPQGLCPGATPAPLTSTAGASGGTGTYAYQWESSPNNSTWTPIAGATGADYAPGPLTATTYYRRRATSGVCGLEYSSSVALTLLPPLNAGSISASQTICTGTAPSSFSSGTEASGGTGTFTYQWEVSADNANWNPIAGATGLIYATGPLTATTYYRRRATSGTGTCSTAVSNVLTIVVQPFVTPSVSLAAPPTQCPGTALTFAAVATNVGPTPGFQWFVNNVAVASGPTFTSSTLVTGDQVRVEVTPTAGLCVTANLVAATVTVTRTPTPTPTLAITVQPNGPVCLGAPLTFSIASVTEAGLAPAYQWQVNGNDVNGAIGPVFTSTTLRDGQLVTLRLRTVNACGQSVTVVSNGVGVRIQPPVVVNAGPDKEILLGTSVVLEGTADGNYPVTWTPATGLTIPANDPLHPVAAPTATTTYTLSAGVGGCASSDQVTVTVRPPIRIPNAFTPNGDGRDDTWQIEFIEQFPDNTVNVFNRWGNKVFSVDNYSRANEWRGDINGQPAPVGTYYYVVVTKGPLGRSYAGSITVLY